MAKDIRIIPSSGQINVTGSADFRGANNSSVLFVSGSGRVGISTTDPSDDLHIAGTFRATDTSGHRIGNGTDTSKALSILDTGMTAGDTNIVSLGRNAANNNQAEITFHLAQTGSTSNRLQLGLYNSNDTLNILGSGRVGIGTVNPDQKLHVFKGSAGSISSNANAVITAENSTSGYIQLLVPDAQESGILFGRPTNGADGGVLYNSSINRGLEFRTAGNSVKMVINDGGRVGIGTTNPIAKLDVYSPGAYSSNDALLLRAGNSLNASGSNQILMSWNGGTQHRHAIKTRHNSGAPTGNAIDFYVWDQVNNAAGTTGTKHNLTLEAGNVGIGVTNPIMGLHIEDGKGFVVGQTTTGGSIYISPTNENTINSNYGFAADGSDFWINYRGYQDGFTYFRNTKIGDGKGNAVVTVTGATGDVSMTGDLTVDGIITAKEFHTTFVSASIIYQSGSTQFGDTSDDTHEFTGTVDIVGDQIFSGTGASHYGNPGAFNTDSNGDKITFFNDGTSYDGRIGIGGTSNLWLKSYGETSGEGDIEFYAGGSRKVIIKGSGNVGIGTSAPVGDLFVGTGWDQSTGGDNIYIKSGTGQTDYDPDVNNSTDFGLVLSRTSTNTTGPDKPGLVLYNNDTTAGGFTPMLLFAKREAGGSPYKAATAAIYSRSPLGTGNGDAWIDGELIFATAGAASQGIKQRMVIDKEGSVGIGTTAPAQKLDVRGNIRVGDGHFIGNETTFDNLLLQSSTGENIVVSSAESLYFKTGGTGPGATGDTRLFVSSSGNVGIGTITPKTTLQVGTGVGSLNKTATLFVPNANALMGTLYTGHGIAAGEISTDAVKNLTLQINDVTKLTVSASGQIQLSDYGSGNFTANSVYRLAVDANGNIIEESLGDGAVNGLGASRYITRWTDTDSLTTSSMYEDGNGNIGIGTTSPTADLHIADTNSDVLVKIHAITGANDPILEFQGNSNDITVEGFQLWYDNSVGDMHLSTTYANDDAAIRFHTRTGASKSTINERLTIAGDGNVGIGTTNPGSPLHVAGDIGIAPTGDGVHIGKYSSSGNVYGHIQLQGNKGGYIDFSTSGTDFKGRVLYDASTNYMRFDTNSSEKMRINTNGNLGIGTTAPSRKLHVAGDAYLQSGNLFLTQGNYITWNSGDNYIKGISGYHLQFTTYDGVSAQNEVVRMTGGSEASGGARVGIGTTTPSAKLEVYRSGSTVLDIQGSQGQLFSVTDELSGSLMSVNDITGIPILEVFSDDRVVAGTFGANTLVVDGSNVGIGTSTPDAKLHVDGNIRIPNQGKIIFGSAGTPGDYLELNDVNSSGKLLKLVQDGTTRFDIEGVTGDVYMQGSVGIGTTSPSHPLHVEGFIATNHSSNASGLLVRKAGTTIGFVGQSGGWVGDTTDDLTISGETGKNIRFYTNGSVTERMRIASDGNVGIGVTNPAKILDIDIPDASHADYGIRFNSGGGYGGASLYHDYGQGNGTTVFKITNDYADARINLTQDSYDAAGSPSSIRLFTAPAGGGGTGIERMRIASDGKVGIGTTAPDFKLDTRISRASGAFLTDGQVYALGIQNTDGTAGNAVAMAFGHGGYEYTSFIASIRTGTGANPKGDLAFGSRPTDGGTFAEGMRIKSDGNVGIGTTAPSDLLQIYGDAKYVSAKNTSGNIAAFMGTDSSGDGNFSLYQSAGGAAKIKLYAESNAVNYINNGGNFGVGLSNPTKGKLQVYKGSATNHIALDGGDDYSKVYMGNFLGGLYLSTNYYYQSGQFQDTGSLRSMEMNMGTDFIAFNTMPAGSPGSRTKVLYISGSQNRVGINTDTPEYTLDVNASSIKPTADLLLGEAAYSTSTDYIGMKTTFQTGGNGYMIISGKSDGNTYVSAKDSAGVFVRGGGNLSSNQIFVPDDNYINIDTTALYVNGALDVDNGVAIGGDLTVDGIVTAKEFHTTFVSASIIYQSGSTKFGDTADDLHSFTGSIDAGFAGNSSANYAALRVTSAGTGTAQAAIVAQQKTSEGDTIIFADYEPYVEYNFMHENNSNHFIIHSGGSTNSLGTNTFYNRSGTARTGYKKWVLDQVSGDMYVGGSVGIGTSSSSQKLEVNGNVKATNFIGGNEAGIYTFNDTVNASSAEGIFTIANNHGAQAFRVTFVCSTSGYSAAKTYEVVHSFGNDPIFFKVVDSGAYSGHDFDVSFTDDISNTGVRCTITNNSTSINADIATTVFLGGSPTDITVTAL